MKMARCGQMDNLAFSNPVMISGRRAMSSKMKSACGWSITAGGTAVFVFQPQGFLYGIL